jgi:hypothetical protein
MNAADKSQTELAKVIGGKARRGNWRGGANTITISPLPSNGISAATTNRSNDTMKAGTTTSLTSDTNAVYDNYGHVKGGTKRRRHRKRNKSRKSRRSSKKSRRTRRR